MDNYKTTSFFFSLLLHTCIFLIFSVTLVFNARIAVLENSNKRDIINAVVLGDIKKSNILPQKSNSEPIIPEKKPILIKNKQKPPLTKDAIAIKKNDKKLIEKKYLENIKKNNIFGKDLLQDIEEENVKHKKNIQKKIQKKFEKTLQEQTEKTLRQQLFNDEIKLQSIMERQAQGEINKYTALILQAISENWLVPPGVNRKLTCEVMIHLADNGTVLSVDITKTSGDVVLDNSSKAAVLKASPLPVPKSKEAFKVFKNFVLKLKPENLFEQH